MGKNNRKRKLAHGAWEKVDVGLVQGSDVNHYDSDKTAPGAVHDLEADPSEAMGMFFGLEVLDGSQYVMEQRGGAGSSSHFTILDHENPKEEQGGTVMPPPTETAEDAINGSVAAKRARNKAKRKKRNAEARKAVAVKEKRKFEEDEGESSEGVEEIQKVQWEWMKCGVELENNICRSLASQGFWQPTPIQEAVLAPAILGRRNIVGAAPTGSGKTLAFLIPIYQLLISKMAEPNLSINQALKPLEALILTPTRELALQIHKEALKLTKYLDQKHRKWIGCLTGGLALAKQKRVLQQQPAVLVATVGRLWELISSREHEHLTDLSQVRFLVIDEADRMVQQGSFPELSKILDTVQCCNPMDDESDDEEDSVPEDPERLLGLPGIPGEARVTMLSDELLARLEGPPGENTSGDSPVVRELDDDEFEEQLEKEGTGDSYDDISLPALPPVNRQTFVYSATLTLPASSDTTKKNKKSRRAVNVDGEIAQILDKARAKGQTKVVDLTKVSGSGKNSPSVNSGTVKNEQKAKLGNSAAFRLPPGLKLQQIKCTQLHKDSHLYAYLMTTVDGSSGPTLVFCNSIAAVRRVGATLQTLGLKVRLLHAQMQQRARFQAVESLKKQNERAIVVASDVAARGLDIPSVATVIHYDAARSIDTFVHRAGRTARGMGEGAVGCSLCLLSPSEDKFHSRIVAALRVDFAEVCLDGRLLGDAQERVNLASKVYSAQDSERKVQRDNQWFQKQAEEAGLELDDDMIGDGLAGGSQRDRVRLQEARLASDRLRSLLKQPMRTQRFGKFLSTNSARSQKVIPPPTILPPKTDQ